MTWDWLPFGGDSDTAAESSEEDTPAFDVVDIESDRSLETPADIHQSLVAPSEIERTPTAIRTGERWARTFWIGQFPDAPRDGLFENLYSTAETRMTDISMHITPRDTQTTLDSLENKIEDLEAELEYLSEKRRAGARGVNKDLQDYQELYDVLRNTSMEAFDVSMYLTERGETNEDITSETVANAARRAPANLTPVSPRWAQLDALISASPVGVDKMNLEQDTQTPMLGGALGAMFPFVSGAMAEHGIEYGTYALNESPLLLDRFARQTGYCVMVIGKLGAGKSFSTKLQLLRRAMHDQDTVLVMLDPLEGFASLNDALGGERVTVGGSRSFNPLEIQPTPTTVLDTVPDLDPWAEQIAWVLTFFETFFEQVAGNPLGDRKQTLRRCVQETYEQQGITRDPATHDQPSPTVRDVIDVLEQLLDDPAAFGYVTAGEQENVRTDAESLLIDLRPSFREGGDLANLAEPTELDIASDVVYLDLHQEEGTRGRSETSLMMQVLFNAVYERAKQTDKRVVFAIDEAHYLMNDATSLDFLETAVRHSRHYDISLQFITQTGGEFALTPEARTIANLCSMTVIHRVDEAAQQLAEWFGLSDREVDWVQSAKAGNGADGYSEALLGVDEEGWFPIRVRASEYEVEVIGD
ncbi:transfer complex protein [Haloarcula marismortui ATCC 43049]|uniref:Transfer complex protein n=1 Tax=Haloarcula marismortui (strain ATCC 43049 / DSM 3752 / JCM 8966 / VKM B-1809) TaxID=272569 RepID=Q5V378_HALMA|nr:transfer complex protein [Haloarcula marismortui]AAV46024.1 transfer complex protein [Haloarcula marismortui ATCC 43049]QCP90787.1 transfer complex protein [Haloarcula marismortui ATCC 43049]